MEYHPRADCTDVPIWSDDRWFTHSHLHQEIVSILKSHEATTNGISETPLYLDSGAIDTRVERWTPRLRHLGRINVVDGNPLYHWTVAELIAYEALHEFWSVVLRWPLGWWPWSGTALPALPDQVGSPAPFAVAPGSERDGPSASSTRCWSEPG